MISHTLGVFTLWEDKAEFKRVGISEDGAIYRTNEVELCPDALYMKLTGKKPEEILPKLKPSTHA